MYSSAKVSILLYENLSIYLYQKMTVQSYSLHLDPSSQIVVARLIREMNRDLGTTVVVSSHNLTSINDICGRILLLEKGKLLLDKLHQPRSVDPDLETYFIEVAQ